MWLGLVTRTNMPPVLFTPDSVYLLRNWCLQYLGILCFSSFLFADFYFITQLGFEALQAVSIASPIILFLITFLLRLGTGNTVWVAREVKESSLPTMMVSVTFVTGFAVFFAVIFWVIGPRVYHLFTANNTLLNLLQSYMNWVMGGMVLVGLLMGLLTYVRGLGDHKTIARALGLLALTNLVLDPLFIFGGLGISPMGMDGAAIASLVAVLVSAGYTAINIWPQRSQHQGIPWRSIKTPLMLGLPLAFMGVLVPLRDSLGIGLSRDLAPEALAALGIGHRIDLGIQLFFFALVSVVVPYLAQRTSSRGTVEIRHFLKAAIMGSLLYVLLVVGGLQWQGAEVAQLLTENALVRAYLQQFLYVVPSVYLLFLFMYIGNAWLTALGKTREVAFVGTCSMIFQMVTMVTMVEIWGFLGLILSYLLTAVFSVIMVVILLRGAIKSVFL